MMMCVLKISNVRLRAQTFDVYLHDEYLGNYEIPMFGKHNILNSLAVIAVSHMEKVDQEEIKKELLTFKGVKRRFTEKRVADMVIIDDYAHHPSGDHCDFRCCAPTIPRQEDHCSVPTAYF